jgi:hypothetical protein
MFNLFFREVVMFKFTALKIYYLPIFYKCMPIFQGHKVQIYVPTEYVSSWRDDLKEYHPYEMYNFKDHNNDLQFKASKN